MATSATFKGQAVEWGTTELGTPVANGICVNGSVQHQGATDPVENEDGARTGIVFYDESYTATLTVVCKASCTAPSIGDSLTVDSLTVYVTDVKKDWQNKGKKQLTITAESGANISSGSGSGTGSGTGT